MINSNHTCDGLIYLSLSNISVIVNSKVVIQCLMVLSNLLLE